ncbi:MAG: hypothetical protein UY58_C0001G0008 [Candidatus Magasanikbacteria bacterium GW2011_GWA2_50_22]|uniref:Dephospho-CoA kinase n=1 Tax=Candidatus Magasanikbacteria bacterium GW2011_GWA2_50_22 TaxID=1619043 RepID=A0A0G1WFL5_9BACT|nr:MAG: hypothetical protein UY58_C0001G0008 [Candidatus Magasanikbacteria bacterium GW2011_GWA2_50_22]
MPKIILGLVGEIAAGKSTATEYLKQKYGAVSFRFSDPLRDILARLHIENSRPNLQALSTFLRRQYGEDLLSKVMALDAGQSPSQLIITEGIRRPTDAADLKKFDNFHIISLAAPERTRYQRLIQRSENADDKTKTWEQFQADGRAESEQKIKETAAQADFIIDNKGTTKHLYRQIDDVVKRLQS